MKAKRIAASIILILLSASLLYLVTKRISMPEAVADDTIYTDISANPTQMPEQPPEQETVPDTEAEPKSEPEITAEPESEVTPEPEPEPYADKPDININDWMYVLANTENLLDKSFAPELTSMEYGHSFDSRAVDALKSFMQGARDAGLSVTLTSSYRSYSTQESLFNNKLAQYGGDYAAAARIVAIPGSSEHQTGLAADITDRYYEYMNESLADTDLSKWMKAHCAEYGFILRFPEDKQEITGIMFEPWHFRYVGEEAAKYIMENGLCLEEFVALYK